MVSVGELWIYLGFFVTLVAAGLGLPAPEELVVSGAGVLAGRLPPDPEVAQVAGGLSHTRRGGRLAGRRPARRLPRRSALGRPHPFRSAASS